MTSENIKSASLAEIRKMRDEGKTLRGNALVEDDRLPDDFWDTADVVSPREVKSVHLKLDKDVFDFFKGEGKGHLTRMQNVLAAYVEARQRS